MRPLVNRMGPRAATVLRFLTTLVALACCLTAVAGNHPARAGLALWGTEVWTDDPAAVSTVNSYVRACVFGSAARPGNAGEASAPGGMRLVLDDGGAAKAYVFTEDGLLAPGGRLCSDLAAVNSVFDAIACSCLTGSSLGTLISSAAASCQVRFPGVEDPIRLKAVPPTLAGALCSLSPTTAGGGCRFSTLAGLGGAWSGQASAGAGTDTPDLPFEPTPAVTCRIEIAVEPDPNPTVASTDALTFTCLADNNNTVSLVCGPYCLDLQPCGMLVESLASTPEIDLQARVGLPDEEPLIITDPETLRLVLVGLAPFLDDWSPGVRLGGDLIAPINLSIRAGEAVLVSCQVGPGATVAFGGCARIPSHYVPVCLPDLACARALAPDRLVRQLEAIADLRLTAGDSGLETPVGPEAKAKLVEALSAATAENAGDDAYPSGWCQAYPAYTMSFTLSDSPAQLALVERNRAVLCWGGSDAVGFVDGGQLLAWACSVCPVPTPGPTDLTSLFFTSQEVTFAGGPFGDGVSRPERDRIVRMLKEGTATAAPGSYTGEATIRFTRPDGTAAEALVGRDGLTFAGQAYRRPDLLRDLIWFVAP